MSASGNTVVCTQCRQENRDTRSTCANCGSPLPVTTPPTAAQHPAKAGQGFRQGQLFAKRYVIQRILGRGGMGCIYRAHDNTLKEVVALKTLLPELVRDPVIVERFFNEARIARSLSHPNIIRVHDISSAEDVVFISMEFLPGKSLREILDDLSPGQRIGIKTVLRIFDELCAALQYAHRYTIHRDIKPENVMIAADGHVKLMDFGISKLMDHTNLTQASMVMGTPQYMSPEQLRNTAGVDGRADIYSVGVMLYEVITGNIPTGVPKPVSEISQNVPPAIDPIIAKCVASDPNDRYQTAEELREALAEVRKLVEAGSDLIKRTHQPPPKPKRDWSRPIAVAVTAAVIIVFTVLGLLGAERARKEALAAVPPPAPLPQPPVESAPAESYSDWTALLANARGVAASATAELDEDDRRKGFIQTGDDLARASADQAGHDTQAAIAQAIEAIHLYIGAAHRPVGMLFVPKGEVQVAVPGVPTRTESVSAFYIDAAPVSVERFAEFARAYDWPLPGGANEETDQLVAGVTYYDALAFASSLEPKQAVPSLAQWLRAAQYMTSAENLEWWGAEGDEKGAAPLRFANGMIEWTRTVRSTAKTEPDFHSELYTCTAQRGSDGSWFFTPAYARFGARNNSIGFRGVYSLPKNLNRLAELVGS